MSTPAELQDTRNPVKLAPEPGFFTEASDSTAAQRWKEGDRVRFKNGLPQKIGGWDRILDEAGVLARIGLVRRYWEWSSLDGQKWIAEGTHKKLYLINSGQRFDITPIRRTVVLVNPFTTVISSAVVTVSDPGHGAQTGDFVRFTGASAVGGITISGEYEVTVLNGNSYTITHSAAATSSAGPGGGNVQTQYDISAGFASSQTARGWGTCLYDDDTYGTPRSPTCSGLVSGLRLWSLDNFGEDLIASPRGGAIYRWDRTLGPTTRAQLLPDAPPINQRVLVSPSGGRVVCLGSFDLIANQPDPMLIVAGEEENLDIFREPLPGEEENDVYIERAAKGSKLITGLVTRTVILLFSDKAPYVLLPDANDIFDLQIVGGGDGNSVVGPNAAIDINGTVYWMGQKKFLKFDGVMTEIPCTVWGHVFDNADADEPGFNEAQADKVYAWHNEDFNEIWWQYPSAESEENDRAVIYNYAENLWYFLSLDRTAMLAKGPAYGVPIGGDATVTYQHETGTDAFGAPLNEFLESWDIEMGDGKVATFVNEMIPDMKRHVGTLLVTLKTKNRPAAGTYVTKGPYPFTPGQTTIGVRAQGRQLAVRFSSNTLGTDWRLGQPRLYGQADGEGR